MDEFEMELDKIDERAAKALVEFMLGGRRGKRRGRGQERSAAKAFGVTEADLEAIKNMPGATWTEDEYRRIAGNPFVTCQGFNRK